MKILIFSDTHLTNQFETHKYEFLQKIIGEHDRVIINGDFWDSWLTDFDSFIKSKWNKIFPLLLEKNTIYIHGDHDPSQMCDERTNLFSITSLDSYLYKSKDRQNIVYMEHGHNLIKNKRRIHIKLFLQFQKAILSSYLRNPWCKFIYSIENIAHTTFGPNIFAESATAKNLNKQMKQRG